MPIGTLTYKNVMAITTALTVWRLGILLPSVFLPKTDSIPYFSYGRCSLITSLIIVATISVKSGISTSLNHSQQKPKIKNSTTSIIG